MLHRVWWPLHVLTRTVKAKLTGASTKADVIERLIVLSQVGSLGEHAEQDNDGIVLSYLDANVRQELLNLPKFEEFELCIKSLEPIKQFHFVNLYVYLVESRDKTFDKESLRALKSLKGYKFLCGWLCEKHVALSPSRQQAGRLACILPSFFDLRPSTASFHMFEWHNLGRLQRQM